MMENPFPDDDLPQEEEPISESPEPGRHAGYSVMQGVQTVVSVALVMATLLTLGNPRKAFNTPKINALVDMSATQAAIKAQEADDRGNHIGLLSGHWQNSTGEVCADGLIETDVNQDITARTAQMLEEHGYQVDLFPEFDLAFLNYEGAAFIAIYSGSCAEAPLPPSGFKVGGSLTAQNPELVDSLATCISKEYQKATSLPFTFEVINPDHFSYHIFRDINPATPAVRLEMGSLKTDRTLLVDQAEKTADGIAAGILCYLNNQSESD